MASLGADSAGQRPGRRGECANQLVAREDPRAFPAGHQL